MVIIWLILITISLDNLWILLGENWCWSLLGLKGLIIECYNNDNKNTCSNADGIIDVDDDNGNDDDGDDLNCLVYCNNESLL